MLALIQALETQGLTVGVFNVLFAPGGHQSDADSHRGTAGMLGIGTNPSALVCYAIDSCPRIFQGGYSVF
jgi:hypothetical protein